ncbi:MAG: AgmX/PglI C-terminal domain-containing protein, partial [Candidatus Binataceae bacterium]
MKSCPQCAKSYPDSEMFCADDGAALVSQPGSRARRTELVTPTAGEQPSGIECPVCGGRALSPDEEICAFCGARLRPPRSAPAAAPSPAAATARSQTTRSPQPSFGEQTFDDEPTTPPARGTGRVLGVAGYAVAALAALAAGAWFAIHLSANHAQQAKLAPEASASPPAAAEPMVALAANPQLQVTGESASDPARNQDAARKVFEDHKAALLDPYKHALEADKSLADGMIATLRVAPTGEVSSGSVATSTNVNPALDSEVIKEMTGWRFAPFSGSAVEVRYPVVFVPSPDDQSKVEAQLADT